MTSTGNIAPEINCLIFSQIYMGILLNKASFALQRQAVGVSSLPSTFLPKFLYYIPSLTSKFFFQALLFQERKIPGLVSNIRKDQAQVQVSKQTDKHISKSIDSWLVQVITHSQVQCVSNWRQMALERRNRTSCTCFEGILAALVKKGESAKKQHIQEHRCYKIRG